ncbi:MAG: hypothetical protein HQ569_04150 [Actinobacteria bacterium]|nr:hypothetical protein [Actinomycetota bacterium]
MKTIVSMVKIYTENADIPVVLHLNECLEEDLIFKCIRESFPFSKKNI